MEDLLSAQSSAELQPHGIGQLAQPECYHWPESDSCPPEPLQTERLVGRTELASDLIVELRTLARDIRDEWTAARSQHGAPEAAHIADAYYAGQIEAYNRVALDLHKQDAEGFTNAEYLPEVLHAEGIKSSIDRAVGGYSPEQLSEYREHLKSLGHQDPPGYKMTPEEEALYYRLSPHAGSGRRY